MRSHAIRFRSIAAVGALTLTLAGCSGSDTGSGGSTKGTVKVGTLCFKSGDTVAPESCTVVEAMAKAANAARGASGYRIEAVGCDVNRSDPTALPNCIRKLVHRDKVQIFVGNYQSAGLFKEIEPRKVASLASTFASAEDFTSPMAFPIWGHSSTGLPETAKELRSQGLKKPGAIVVNNVAGQASVKAVQSYYSTVGIKVDVIPASPAESDYTPFVSQARAKGNDPLVVLQSAAQIATISRAAQGLGYKPTIIAPYTAFDENFLKQAGSALDGMVLGSGYKPWTDTPEGEELRKVMRDQGFGEFNMNLAAVQSYVGMKVLFQVLDALPMKDPKPADISGALAKGTFANGFLPAPISWADLTSNPPTVKRVASLKVVVLQVKGAKLNVIATRDFA